MATFAVSGPGRPRMSCTRTRSGPSWVEADGVEAHRRVGVGVLDALDLVEQLGGDGADGDRAAGARVLGDDRRAVGRDLGDREARMLEAGDLLEEGVVPAGALACRTR